MIDWKRSKHPNKKSFVKQLNLYRYILMKNYICNTNSKDFADFAIDEMYIVRLHPNCKKETGYELVRIPVDEGLAKEALGES